MSKLTLAQHKTPTAQRIQFCWPNVVMLYRYMRYDLLSSRHSMYQHMPRVHIVGTRSAELAPGLF